MNIGWQEILILILIVLLIFGSTRLPALGEAVGKGIKNFQKAIKGEKSADNEKDETEKKT